MSELLDQNIPMENIAKKLNLSYSSFRHRFKDIVGMSPKAYWVDMRMERARNLLTSTDLTVTDISKLMHYDTPYYFMQQFKSKNNMTAKQWRVYSRGLN